MGEARIVLKDCVLHFFLLFFVTPSPFKYLSYKAVNNDGETENNEGNNRSNN